MVLAELVAEKFKYHGHLSSSSTTVGLNDSLHLNRGAGGNYLKDFLLLNDYRQDKRTEQQHGVVVVEGYQMTKVRYVRLPRSNQMAPREDENGGMRNIFAVSHFTIKRSSRMSSPLISSFALNRPTDRVHDTNARGLGISATLTQHSAGLNI